MNTVRVSGTKAVFRREVPRLKRFLGECLRRLKLHEVFLEVILVDNREIQALNKNYRRKDKATNVLSFPIDRTFAHVSAPYQNRRPLGEIYLAPEYMAAHKEDMRFMVAHGLLHLLGFDHKNARAERAMHRLERKLTA
jgi:probable rRNA maturation factor